MGHRRGAARPSEPPDAAAAMEIAARYLATRPRTRWELQRRLKRAQADEAVIELTTERLAALGYLDDAAFARWWGEQRDRHAPRGRRMIEAELRQHGVGDDVIDASRGEHAAPERDPEDALLPASEAERARDALASHLRGQPVPTDAKGLKRVSMHLMRRGFDYATVRRAIRDAQAHPSDAIDDAP